MSVSDPRSFWEEARSQRVCAICGQVHGRPDYRGHTWHAHHAIPRRTLRRLGLPEYDTRGALRVCTDCHYSFEHGGVDHVVITVAHLTDANICYCWDVLGVTAVQLERTYGDFDLDPRWPPHRMGECGLCQHQPT